jgi:endonuclease III
MTQEKNSYNQEQYNLAGVLVKDQAEEYLNFGNKAVSGTILKVGLSQQKAGNIQTSITC